MWPVLLAQAAAAAAPAQAVISYPPSYFAAQRPANAGEMLARVPGFTLDDGAAVRGFEGSAGNVLVDGQRPATKVDRLETVLARIPAGRVERIDIIRGGAPGVDMQGKPVLANVVLKKDHAFRAQIEANVSRVPDGRPLGGLEWQASGGADGRSWETSGLYAKGYSALLGPGVGLRQAAPGAPTEATRIRTEDDGHLAQVNGAYERALAGGKLRVNGMAYHDNIKFEEDDTGLAAGATQSTDQLMRDELRELGATFNRPLPAGASLELVGLRQTNGMELSSASTTTDGPRQLFQLDSTTREDIARAVVKRSWGEAFSAELGAESAGNRLRSATRFLSDDVELPLPAANVRVRERRAEAFAKASWRMSPALSLDGQLRYERSTISATGDVALEKTLGFVKPRLLATWAWGSSQLRLRAEREVGQLDFSAFVAQGSLNSATGVTAGNPDLEPERAWTAEAAFEQRFLARGALVLTATHSEVQGVVDRGPVFTPAGVFDRPANIGDGSRDILRIDLTLPLDRFGLKGAQLKGVATRRWSRVEDPTTRTSRRISGQRPTSWEAHFTQDVPAKDLTWGFEAYGDYQEVWYRFNAVDAYKRDPYLMAFVEWRPRPDVNLRVELENVTERGYRHTTTSFSGVRDAAQAGPAALSDRNFNFGRILYVRLRKTFGG